MGWREELAPGERKLRKMVLSVVQLGIVHVFVPGIIVTGEIAHTFLYICILIHSRDDDFY